MNNYLTTSRDLKKAYFLDGLSGNEMKRMKQLILKNGKVSGEFSSDKSSDKIISKNNNGIMSIVLYEWVFEYVLLSENEFGNEHQKAENQQTNQQTNQQHNKEVFNQEIKKQNAQGAGVKCEKGKAKIRYPVESIAIPDFPYTHELISMSVGLAINHLIAFQSSLSSGLLQNSLPAD